MDVNEIDRVIEARRPVRALIRRIMDLPEWRQIRIVQRAGFDPMPALWDLKLQPTLRNAVLVLESTGHPTPQREVARRLWAATNYELKQPIRNPFVAGRLESDHG